MKRGPRDLSKKTIPQLKTTLDGIFGKWVLLNWSPNGETVACYTCGKVYALNDKNIGAGHFLAKGSYSSERYCEDNVRPQDFYPCNHKNIGNGRPVEFEYNLRLEIGDDVVDALKTRARELQHSWKWNRADLIEKIEYYRAELKR